MQLLSQFLIFAHVVGAGLILGMSFFAYQAISAGKVSDTSLAIYSFLAKYGKTFGPLQLLSGIGLGLMKTEYFKYPMIYVKLVVFIVAAQLASTVIRRAIAHIDTKQKLTGPELATLKRVSLINLSLYSFAVLLGVIMSSFD